MPYPLHRASSCPCDAAGGLACAHWFAHEAELAVVTVLHGLFLPAAHRAGRVHRLLPHAAASMLNDKVNLFNNQVASFGDIYGKTVRTLHTQLLETASWDKRIALVEAFLLQQLALAAKDCLK